MSSSTHTIRSADAGVNPDIGAPTHVRPDRPRGCRPAGARDHAADPAIRLAAAGRAHRLRGLGQAREPHSDRRLQGAQRHRLHRRAAPSGGRMSAASSRRRAATWPEPALRPRGTGPAVTVVVPQGNSVEKNAAMRASGPSWWSMAANSTRPWPWGTWPGSAGWRWRRPSIPTDARRRHLCAGVVPGVADSTPSMCRSAWDQASPA